MFNNYLADNSISWLLEKSDPSVRYHVLREILGDKDSENEYEKIFDTEEINGMINVGKKNILGNQKNFDLLYNGSMWCFCEAVERGLDRRSEIIIRTADYISEKAQMPSGGFTINWMPRTEVACRTGDMLRYMIRAGFRDDRIETGIKWIADHQRHDGGWLHCPLSDSSDLLKLMFLKRSGKGLAREGRNDVKSCFYATIACSMALMEYQVIGKKYLDNIEKAVEFFLRQKFYLNSENRVIEPKKQWNRDFRLLGYPVQSQYDILYGMLFVSRAGYYNDKRTGKAFNIIMEKQNGDGTWNLENAQPGMLFGGHKKGMIGKKNKWITLNVLRLLKYITDNNKGASI